MAVDFNEIVKYARKVGIFDIEEAFNLLREEKLPENKKKALRDVMSFAKEKGVADLPAAAFKYDKESGKKKDALARYAMENDLDSTRAAYYKQFKEKIEGAPLVQAYANSMGFAGQGSRNDLVRKYGGDQHRLLEDAKKWAATQTPEALERFGSSPQEVGPSSDRNTPVGRQELDQRYKEEKEAEKRKAWELMREKIFQANQKRQEDQLKLLSGGVTRQEMKEDPLWGSPAYREQVLKYNPSTTWHDEELLNSVRHSPLYGSLQVLGQKQLPERQMYNRAVADYMDNPWFSKNTYSQPNPQQPQQQKQQQQPGWLKSLLGY